jgi:site-specific recombinase XerD
MLDSLYPNSAHVHRLRANPLGALFDRFAQFLLRRGHAALTSRCYLNAAAHFGYWLGTQSAPVTVDAITKAAATGFLDEHLPTCSCPLPFPRTCVVVGAALNHLLRMLAQDDPSRSLRAQTPYDVLLAQYDHFLHQTCGLAEQTRSYRLRSAREFLQRSYGGHPADFSRLRPADFQDYFRRYASHLKPRTVASLATSLRGFFRFLAIAQASDPALAAAIPQPPRWARDRLPRVLSDAELQALLDAFDTSTATGRRDLAMVRCMSDLGLRVGDVVALTLDDIDWRQGVLKLPPGKWRREQLLPLPALLGEAIAAYLRQGRPSSTERHLFLRHTVVVGTPLNRCLVWALFKRAYARATGRSDAIGPHVLRHTAATRMRVAGHSLKSIADVLGHKSVDTTTIYVRLDVEALRAVALPWPGGVS